MAIDRLGMWQTASRGLSRVDDCRHKRGGKKTARNDQAKTDHKAKDLQDARHNSTAAGDSDSAQATIGNQILLNLRYQTVAKR